MLRCSARPASRSRLPQARATAPTYAAAASTRLLSNTALRAPSCTSSPNLPSTRRVALSTPSRAARFHSTPSPRSFSELDSLNVIEGTEELSGENTAEALGARMPALAPGDLVEVVRRGRPALGILIEVSPRGFGPTCKTLLDNGHCLEHRESDVVFQIPAWSRSGLALRPLSPFEGTLYKTGLSPESSAILEKIQIPSSVLAHIPKFSAASLRYTTMKAKEIEGLYSAFRADEPDAVRIVTVNDVARHLFAPAKSGSAQNNNVYAPTSAELHAAFAVLMKSERYFGPRDYRFLRQKREFIVRSQDEVERIDWLMKQMREHLAYTEALRSSEKAKCLPPTPSTPSSNSASTASPASPGEKTIPHPDGDASPASTPPVTLPASESSSSASPSKSSTEVSPSNVPAASADANGASREYGALLTPSRPVRPPPPETPPALTLFLEKVRKMITWYRETNGLPSTSADASPPLPVITYTVEDNHFFDAVKAVAMEPRDNFNVYRPFVLGSMLRNLAPLFSDRLHSEDCGTLLRECGVWTRWENLTMYRKTQKGRVVWLEGHGMRKWAEPVGRLMEKCGEEMLEGPEFNYDAQGRLMAEPRPPAAVAQKTPAAGEAPTHNPAALVEMVKTMIEPPSAAPTTAFYQTDLCAAIRRDFGDMPVYVIDDPTAHELDDGMSIEETPAGTWIHVHIADPTAYIPPSHPLALVAQLRGNSVYLPERHYPMMPDALSNERFNLGAGLCAMTFSARLGSDGEIADYAVTPSILRNVKILHYDDIDAVLDWSTIYGISQPAAERSPWVQRYFEKRGITGPGKPSDSAPGVDARGAAELRILQKLTRSHFELRLKRGGFTSDQPDASLRVTPYPQPITPLRPVAPFVPSPEQYPTISITPTSCGILAPAHTLVSESMMLAGRVAAKFCADRSVPAAFRGQPHILTAGYTNQDLPTRGAVKEMLDSVMAGRDPSSGVISNASFRRLLPVMPPASMTLHPAGHYSMGIPGLAVGEPIKPSACVGYVKVTSPLRRFKDMVVHWNIKTRLLADKTGTTPRYAFDLAAVKSIGLRMHALERSTNALSKSTDKHWATEWVYRREMFAQGHRSIGDVPVTDLVAPAIDHSRPLGPKTDAVVYTGVVVNDSRVMVIELGGTEEKWFNAGGAKPGDVVKIVVDECVPYRDFMAFRPA
ncbi:hypothetical protein BDK51DRAFT_38780 [Blyttiomyces helicus]|uniref:RNB domain-containing protein n=1 Tax=Blyttiomyces helicus TaxID=388810 RepID=A0A4P9WF56_9FUNG|nr:hypothetical protein BDK51DRAFT_38780 [Blyttiomyces helicus]|eukprot:RKO90363.1 hypothetical protein BDK51DRAFT_38780 [Blyttiomyces helicus]